MAIKETIKKALQTLPPDTKLKPLGDSGHCSPHWDCQPRDSHGRWVEGSQYIPKAKLHLYDVVAKAKGNKRQILARKTAPYSPTSIKNNRIPSLQDRLKSALGGSINTTDQSKSIPTGVGMHEKLKSALAQNAQKAKNQIDAHTQKRIDDAQNQFDQAAKTLKLKQSQAEANATKIYTPQQAAAHKNLKEVEIPKATDKLARAEKELSAAKAAANLHFEAGKPMDVRDLATPLFEHEQGLANSDKSLNFNLKSHEAAQLPQGHHLREKFEQDVAAFSKAKKVAPNLSTQEFKAINHYTGSGYVGINGALRGLQENPNSEQAQQQRVQAKVLHQALQKIPTFEGTVRRDTRIPTKDLGQYQEGRIVTFHGATSTTTDLSGKVTANYGKQSKADALAGATKNESAKASKYEELAKSAGIRSLPPEASTQVEYRIKSKSGRQIADISKAAKESEVVLPHGWQGKVTKIEDNNGVKRIHLEEI